MSRNLSPKVKGRELSHPDQGSARSPSENATAAPEWAQAADTNRRHKNLADFDQTVVNTTQICFVISFT